MLAVWILLGIFAPVALLMILPLRIYLNYTPENGLQYKIKYCLIPLVDSERPAKPKKPAEEKPTAPPQAQKKKKEKPKGGKSAVSSLLSFLGLEDVSTAAKAKQSIGTNGLLATVGSVFSAVNDLFSRIFKLIRKGVFKKFDLHIVVGDGDAADAAFNYGTICAAVYPLITLLDSAVKFRSRTVDIRCDFDAEATTARFDGQFYYRPCSFVHFAFGLLWNYLKQTIKGKGQTS